MNSRWTAAAVALAIIVFGASIAIVLRGDDATDASPTGTTTPASGTPAATSTATPSAGLARIVDCPVDKEVCDFAVKAEDWVRHGDAESLIADGSSWDNANDIARLRESIQGSLPVVSRGPRLASIGCPVLEGTPSCAGAFSLTFTTLLQNERAGPDNRRGVLTLGFTWKPGTEPRLTSVAGPDGDDRIAATVSGGRSTGCALSGMPPRTESECILTDFTLVVVEHPVVAGQPPECPLLPELCALALKVEQQLKAGDVSAVAGSADAGATLKSGLTAGLGGEAPRLISIACPFGNTMVFCDGAFALAFTTLDPGDDWTSGGKLVVLRFDGPAASAKFAALVPLDDADTREAAITGGFASKPCSLAGEAAERPGQCAGAYFERYWSAAAFVPGGVAPIQLVRKAAAPPPANSVLFTASGPCWACDASDEALLKHVVDAAGKSTTTPVLENGKGPLDGWVIGQVTGTADAAVLAAMVCDAGYCGPMGSQKPVATWRVIVSRDGGTTWTEEFRERAVYAAFGNVTHDGFVVTTVGSNDGAGTLRYSVVRGTQIRQLEPPAGLPARTDLAVMQDGSVAWIPMSEDGLLVGGLRGEDGTRLPIALPPGAQYPRLTSADGKTWAAWHAQGYRVAMFGAGGAAEATYNVDGVLFAMPVNARIGVGTVAATGVDGGLPALLDFTAHTVTPIGAPFGAPPLPARNRLVAIQMR